MNTYLLSLIGKWVGIVAVAIVSLFDFDVKNIEVVIENNVIDKNGYVKAEVIPHETEYIYNESLPSTYKEVVTQGDDGVVYDTGNKEIIEESITEVIEIGTGKEGIYTGMLTGYGPDCKGCSGLGKVYCPTKDKKTHSLITDGIYYNDEEYGDVRILSADHREFPCGTIIEITNNDFEKEIGIVLDTGSGMIKAFDEGWILIDLAFEKEAIVSSVTNKKTTFVVKRWGF